MSPDFSTRRDDLDRGLQNRRAVLGDAWVDQATGRANSFNAEFQAFITRYAWHEIWGRPGLDHTTRRLLVLGMTMALGRWEEFELHCGAAIRGGVPVDQIRETLLQGAIYCGVPAANTAFKMAARLLQEHGHELAPAPLVDPVRVRRHDTFSTPQLHVALQGEGAGTPMVLAHALGLDLSMWDGVAPALAEGRPVLRYDARGHGRSAVPPGPYTLDALVDDAARLIREWGRGPVVWVGLSMGGMVGQGLAVRHPELLRGLVLANTTAQYPPEAASMWAQRIAAVEAGGVAAVADAAIERFLHPGFRAARPEAAAALKALLLRSPAEGYAASCAAVAKVDWLEALGGVQVPTLVIAGALDMGATPAMGRAIADRIPGARFTVLEEASHISAIEQPERFTAAVAGFLREAGL